MSSFGEKVFNYWIKVFASANSCIKGKHQWQLVYQIFDNYRDTHKADCFQCKECNQKKQIDLFFLSRPKESLVENFDYFENQKVYIIRYDDSGNAINTKQDCLCFQGEHTWKLVEFVRDPKRPYSNEITNQKCTHCGQKGYSLYLHSSVNVGEFYTPIKD